MIYKSVLSGKTEKTGETHSPENAEEPRLDRKCVKDWPMSKEKLRKTFRKPDKLLLMTTIKDYTTDVLL